MSESKVWTGEDLVFIPGDTPFGIYDNDPQFQEDAPKFADWCVTRLGYPIVDIELTPKNLYAVFEEAISEYSAQINQFNIRNNLGLLEGGPTHVSYTGKSVQGSNIHNIIRISESYGSLAGVGGRVDLKKGSIELEPGRQVYDLQKLWSDNHEKGKRMDIMTVYYEATPAINRFFDPYSMTGQGTMNTMDSFGWGGMSPSVQFVLMPIYEDLLRIQQIELNDQIRKSAHSFNIVNNKLTIFPIPQKRSTLWFEYMLSDEIGDNVTIVPDSISDFSNVGYNFAKYSDINDVGLQWIRKYALALAKELLGAIREKYSSIPIPGNEVTLDGAALRSEALTEKETLITQLRENLEEVSRIKQMENESTISQQQQEILNRVPIPIFIG